MTRVWMGLALGFGLAACGGTPPFGGDVGPDAEPGADAGEGSVFLIDEPRFLRLNNIEYDAGSDTLRLNNIPFDDDANIYNRVAGTAFTNGFGAYESAQDGPGELQYFAIFQRSASGNSQVAAVGTDQYVDFGYGGAGAQRLSSGVPTLPTGGAFYVFTGEYAAVRTTVRTAGPNEIGFVTGDVRLTVDFDDFDITGAIQGFVTNRELYDETGAPLGALSTDITLQDSTIDRDTGTVVMADAFELDAGGSQVRSGSWSAVLAGPAGTEIAGYVLVGDGGSSDGDVQEVGGFIAEQ